MLSSVRQVFDILEVEATPEECDTIEIETKRRSTHPRLFITVNGIRLCYTLPGSPGDRRWIVNWRATFRRTYKLAKEGNISQINHRHLGGKK